MHDHRRHGDNDDMTGRRMEVAADSVQAKILARLVMPILGLILIPIVGYTCARLINGQDQQLVASAQMSTAIAVMDERQKSLVIRQLQEHGKHFERIDASDIEQNRRLDRIERVVPTP